MDDEGPGCADATFVVFALPVALVVGVALVASFDSVGEILLSLWRQVMP